MIINFAKAGDCMKRKDSLRCSIDELMNGLKKPHTQKEYEEIHKSIKRLLAIDVLKSCIIPFISLMFSIIALIMKCKTG